PLPLRQRQAAAHVPCRDRPGDLPNPGGPVAHRRHVEEPLVVSADAGCVGEGPAARSARPGQPARHTLDGPERAGGRHSRHRRADVDRLQRLARVHPDGGAGRRVALRPRRSRNHGLHRLMKAVRAAAATVVLALLALLVWDMAHGNGGGIAAKVDHGHVVSEPKMELPFFSRPGTFDLASYRGKVVVLNFWASW